MTKIYFRHFLRRFIEQGGDISKIIFRSTNLVSKYQIQRIKGGLLECIRIKPSGITEDAAFEWPSNYTGGVYGAFTVLKMEVTRDSLLRGKSLIIHLRGNEG